VRIYVSLNWPLTGDSYSTQPLMPCVSSTQTSVISNSVPKSLPTLHTVSSLSSLDTNESLHRDPEIRKGKQKAASARASGSLPAGAKRVSLPMPMYQEPLDMPGYEDALAMPSYDEFGAAQGERSRLSSQTAPNRTSSGAAAFDDHFGFQEKRRHSSILE
jgi:hypothetical protein